MTPVLFGALRGSAVLAATSSSKSSSGSPVFLIIILVLFAVYFLYLRPQRQKLRSQQQQRQAPEVGDEVVTQSGIIGRLRSLEGDRAEVEVAPGQFLTFHRNSLGRRIEPEVPNYPDVDDAMPQGNVMDDDHDHEHDDDHGDGSDQQWWPGSHGETPPESTEGTN